MPRPRSRKNIARKRNAARREGIRELKAAIAAAKPAATPAKSAKKSEK
jgi:hypothetical protein